ncbi:hypothetical protein ACFPYJ_03515 [Paenibacillus solisilvae]|uniref:Heparinase II/III-like protein n=1 Tax=Paenibacillus solisilvae TaxID=2486751 RepID=A0ABW0VVU3_9BACL
MNLTKHLYPVYPVHELEAGFPILAENEFTLDHSFVSPKSNTEFRMYTKGDILFVQIGYESESDAGAEEITLFFDPDHSGRKPHNSVMFTFLTDGSLKYETYQYFMEQKDIPQDVEFTSFSEGNRHELALSLPLRLMRIHSEEKRVLGFNLFRSILFGGTKSLAKWSGLPGDVAVTGQGAGNLLLTRGLGQDEIDCWMDKLGNESGVYYTAWKKRTVPEEIYSYVTEKKRGLTVRIGEDDVRKARENAQHTAWGKRMKEAIVQVADYWAAKSDDELFDLVPVGNPRALTPGQYFGDPLNEGNRTAFQMCLERPYQYYNPATKTWWHNGMQIVNPTTGEAVIVEDDGRGFLAPAGFPNPGVRYMFTASYRLFVISMLLAAPYCPVVEDASVCPETTGRRYAGAISNLCYAYRLTNIKTYAAKALILIGRMAELLPYMNGNYGDGTYSDTVHIAEPSTTESAWLCNFFEAADLIYDVIDELEPDLQRLFSRKPDAEGNVRLEPFRIKTAIRDMIPYLIYSCELEKPKRSDWSMRYIHLELVLASFMGSGKLMRKILFEGKYSLESKILNSFFREGRYAYDSTQYIEHICVQMLDMPNYNYRFQDNAYFTEPIDMFEDERFGMNRIVNLFFHLKSGELTAMFGDTAVDNHEPVSDERKRGVFSYSAALETTYARMKSLRSIIGPVLSLYDREELEENRLRSVSQTYLNHSLLLLATAADYTEYLGCRTSENFIQSSFLLEDSETSIFRAGSNPHNCKHVVLYGQPSAPHVHGDKLGLWIGAYGYHLLAAAGGYPYTWISPKFQAWETHSASSTVVVPDGKNQQHSFSKLRCHYEGVCLSVAGMENTAAYPGSHLERWCWVVQAPNKEDAYVADLNFVSKGQTFDYNTIGLNISFEQIDFSGINPEDWVPMKGTLAGEDIPLYGNPGQGWLKAVRKTVGAHPVSWTFRYPNAALRIHTVQDDKERELICALGELGGQEKGKSRWEPFVVWRDREFAGNSEERFASFFTIMEPYEQKPFLSSVKPLKLLGSESPFFKPFGAEILLPDGYRDILIGTYNEGEAISFRDSEGQVYTTDAKALLLRYKGRDLVDAEAIRYTRIEAASFSAKRERPALTGRIASVDVDRRQIEVLLDHACDVSADRLAGQVAYLDDDDYEKPSSYYMVNPEIKGSKLTFYTDIPLIKLDADWPDPEKRLGLGMKQMTQYEGKNVLVDVKAGDRFEVFNYYRLSR